MLLKINKINKSFEINNQKIKILNDLSFDIDYNEIVSIYGASGSGKSTLLNIISGLLHFDSGEIIFNKELICKDFDFVKFRKNDLGIVFQEDYLLKEFTVIENIMLPNIIAGNSKDEAQAKAIDLLKNFNLLSIKDRY